MFKNISFKQCDTRLFYVFLEPAPLQSFNFQFFQKKNIYLFNGCILF